MRVLLSFSFLLMLFFSCKEKNSINKNPLSKSERLDSILLKPLSCDYTKGEVFLGKHKFYKSYILLENLHYTNKPDSLIRYSTLNGDVFEIFKNSKKCRIQYLRFRSRGLLLNNGILLGMSYFDLKELLPLDSLAKFHSTFEDGYNTIDLRLDRNNKELKEVIYTAILD